MALKFSLTQATHKGRRPYQEDRFFSVTLTGGLLFGVLDGHGGDKCSQTASELFPKLASEVITSGDPVEGLKTLFQRVDEQTKDMYDGTSASVVYIPFTADVAHVAVLGDSPVLVKQSDGTIWHAPEHNVRTNKAEADAAVARGGHVTYDGYLCATYEGMGLQMARAFGDRGLATVLSREPEINSIPLGDGSWVLACSDGAVDPGHYDAETSVEEVIRYVQSGADAQAIVDRAVAVPTGDNVTALLVRIREN